MNFKKIENHLDFVYQPASQPAVRLGSAKCTAPEIQHSKGYPVAFTNCCSEDDLSTTPW